MSRIPLSLLFIFMLTDLVYNEEPFHFMYPINNIAVGGQYVIVATENCLHQFTHTLRWLKTTGPQGKSDTICMRDQKRDRNTTYNKILLVYNDTVLTCWNEKEGFCRELHIDNLKPAGEIVTPDLVPQDPKHPARGLIFFAEQSINLFVATFPNKELRTIILRTKDNNGAFIIHSSALSVSLKDKAADLNYVDAFQWKNMFIFPYYPSVGGSPRVVVLKTDTTTLTFHTQSNLICGSNPQRKIILSSFAFESSGGLLWAGIFTTNSTASIDRTALCIFNFTVLETRTRTCINEDFDFTANICRNFSDIMPIHRTPILTHGDLTAVHVKEVEKRLVFFLGTGNGKLLKTQVTLNSNDTANCPEVFYTFTNEAPVFHTIPMDPVDINYLYVATVKEIKRLKIANCEQRESCNDCLSANDPHCGWCPSENRCTMKTECEASTALGKWIGISEGFGKCLKIKAFPKDGKIAVSIEKNPSLFDRNASWNCEIINKDTRETLCSGKSEASSLNCSCQLSAQKRYETATLTAAAKSGSTAISALFQFQKCSQYTEFSCLDCISSGCLWCTKTSKCTSPLSQCENNDYADENKCRLIEENAAQGSSSNVTIEFVAVNRVHTVGKKNVLISGKNLQGLSRVYLFGTSSCKPQVLKVSRHINSTHAEITLPESQNEFKRLCVDFHGNCYNKSILYESASCSAIAPNNTWLSGGRKLRISGRNLDLIDGITISKNMIVKNRSECLGDSSHCYFVAPKIGESAQTYHVKLAIQESTAPCREIIYKEDPTFIKFVVLNKNDDDIEVVIEKTEDELEIQAHEIEVQIHYIKEVPRWNSCNITAINQKSIQCKAKKFSKTKVNSEEVRIEVILGNFKTKIKAPNPSTAPYYFILLVVPLLVIVVIAAFFITRHKSKKLSQKLSKELEELECEIRKEIREGFAELQTDKEVVTMESIGTIPFFDYRHFALNTLFPEVDKTKQDLCEKLCESIPSPFQTRKSTQDEEIVNILKTLFENQNFLVLLIHTLEKQTDFSIKDRCMFASFLTINFQSNLLYLTGLLERLIKDLIEQSSNKHPKLMLRRTETVVEKLLTNWMSTCLYGFLRESVGEPLYSLVSTLNQRIHKGPIDAVTCKALYTLNEDWLLWQITEFSSVELNVYFPKTSEHEDEDTSQYLKVTVLDCDTIDQAKEKILQSFKLNKGYCFEHPLCDIGLELHHGQTFKELSDIDSSNVMMEHNIKKLNTIKHYQIDNGATIKLIVKKNGLPDMEYSRDHYCHLEMPESEQIELQNQENRGKHKFKVKELYLTKLLATKVAVHSAVEKLFRSIWTVPHNKPPIAIKYFFDFLDAQVAIKKITDPDVVHIWKTNSLPLRFWINILKNPQFVLDIKKTALLDICLSVIAQAFMDGFSLAEHQLGTSAPTNKLLYAKDIPLFKEEVKAYYKEIRDAPTLSSTELTDFLTSESKKHENEFKEDMAVKELFKYIEKYFNVIMSTLEKETGFDSEVKELQKLKIILADKNKCVWE